jgi:sarcosine oxidase
MGDVSIVLLPRRPLATDSILGEMKHYDVIVLGLGAMGSASLCQLAKRGMKTLGLDQFAPPHTLGSSHGQTRIIREAYFEHPSYVPIVQRAYELWADLEKETRQKLFVQTGGVMIGPADGVVVRGAIESARQHHLAHEVLSAAKVRSRYPALRPDDQMRAVYEPRAGILFPEGCVAAHMQVATKHGAELRLNEKVVDWSIEAERVVVKTSSEEFSAAKMVVAAGPWLPQIMPELARLLKVERQVLFWFEPKSSPEIFRPSRCPIHLWQAAPRKFFYGFPDLGDGVKIAKHHEGETTTPESVDRTVHESEITEMRGILERFLPEANGRLLSATVCLYTDTPDEHFIIDFHPRSRNVVILSPCSGHGFKFSSAVGEIAADLVEKERSRLDISRFALSRFQF